MLERILPSGVVAVATRSDRRIALFPQEERIVERAIESRRREFATTRACARDALVRLGRPPQPIPAGRHGNPEWPPGIVGSITHCRGYRGAALGRTRDFDALGIDAEPNEPLPPGVLNAIASTKELTWLRRCADATLEVCWDRLLFSLKETVYKAWFSLTAERLGFADANIAIDPSTREFAVRIRPRAGGGWEDSPPLAGHWLVEDGLVVTALALPRAA